MKPGDLVKRGLAESGHKGDHGLFIGYKMSGKYKYAEVMWFQHKNPKGGPISTCQISLLEVVK